MPVYDALVLVSFGGPEGPEDVMPFLENVTRGRGIPRERLLSVAEHYHHFGGRSPLNDQNRALIAALRVDFATHGIDLPIFFGNRNWHPCLADTVTEMRASGVRRALAFVTSAYSSYSGCRQYLEDIARARAAVADAPTIEPLRRFFNHPDFVTATIDRVRAAWEELRAGLAPGRVRPRVSSSPPIACRARWPTGARTSASSAPPPRSSLSTSGTTAGISSGRAAADRRRFPGSSRTCWTTSGRSTPSACPAS